MMRRYQNMKTDLDSLFEDILDELRREKELTVVNDLEGKAKGTGNPFKSITAVRACIPEALIGGLRELTVTITGDSDDFLVEIHTGAWLKDLKAAKGDELLTKGPVKGEAMAKDSSAEAASYMERMQKRLDDFVRKHSEETLGPKNIEEYPE